LGIVAAKHGAHQIHVPGHTITAQSNKSEEKRTSTNKGAETCGSTIPYHTRYTTTLDKPEKTQASAFAKNLVAAKLLILFNKKISGCGEHQGPLLDCRRLHLQFCQCIPIVELLLCRFIYWYIHV